ncbi:MAG: 2-phospho-L-lactate/phosphoenolpyruvate guanylyltransferase [Gaiellales bacterium]|jgi:2-phospho-L-lactate guanylyltransferase|nr:2-phospho-L-lactate/phosphoenolpyruvate guanylyltransferase [Gaiellales bacterium]
MVARSHGGWLALVPVKALPRGKSRLADVLDGDARADLVLFLMRRVVGACLEAGLEVCVVSPDAEVHVAARALGADALDDGGRDLTESVALALARHAGATGIAVLAADLPDVTAAEVRELIAHAHPLALVAAADGTTNAIAACPPSAFRPSYGPASAARHGGTRLRLAGIERDLDTPSDLGLALSACPG